MESIVEMASQFSEDIRYFAHISTDGKLKIWDTATNTLEQEYTPEYHLTAPCKCLHFISPSTVRKEGSPRKKKKRDSQELTSPQIALGTSSGKLLLYSIAKADLETSIDSETSQSINCISSDNNAQLLYTGVEQNVLCWDLEKHSVKSKWKAGNEQITSILYIPDSNRLLTASRKIKLWNLNFKEVLHSYTGHSYDIVLLYYIKPRSTSEAYFISGSNGDRVLNCWSLNENVSEKSSLVSFLMEDVVLNISVVVATDGSTNMAVVTRSGAVHIYRHTLNGKANKPLKPKKSVQVVSDMGQNAGSVTPIPIYCAVLKENLSLLIGYGSSLLLTFENVIINDYEKIQCLIRKDPRIVKKAKEKSSTKIKTPIVDNDVHYLTPYSGASVSTSKRKSDGTMEVPMEKRLENLTLGISSNKSGVPQMENFAHLLVQGLHSKDRHILNTVFQKKDENIIRNTVKRLPLSVIVPLVEELTKMVQGKTMMSQIGALWLHHLIQNHASLLISNPDVSDLLGPIVGSIENRLTLQAPLNRLKGRLNLLLKQVTSFGSQENNQNEEPLLVFNDHASSDAEMEAIEYGVEVDSDNEWVEESSENENGEENEDDEAKEVSDTSDSEMSS